MNPPSEEHHEAWGRNGWVDGTPRRWFLAALSVGFAVTIACVLHARGKGLRGEKAVQELSHRLHLFDLAVVADDDLRHPGWGRAEQAKAGQPKLRDLRPASRLVRPVPVRVIP